MVQNVRESDINIAELRRGLTRAVALTVAVSGGFFALLEIGSWPVSTAELGLLVALLGLGWFAYSCARRRPSLSANILIWGLTAVQCAAMLLLPHSWIPFVSPLLTYVASVLVQGASFGVMTIIAGLSAFLTWRGMRPYPLPGLLPVLAVSTVVTWMVVHALRTALDWAWAAQRRADELLSTARDRQAELAQALKSLDITDHALRSANRSLIEARRQADEARLMKEQFAANVSHELRTPLSLILGFSEIMCLSSEVYGLKRWPAALRQDVYHVYQNSKHLLEMIDDILNLSHFEIAGFSLNKEPTDVGDLVRDAMDLAAHLFRDTPVVLEATVQPDLPILNIDRTRIRQVLLNLLANASRFTEQGAVTIQVSQNEREVAVCVLDTGRGVPPEELPKLFEEFYQVDRSLSRKHGGAGLGLAISKRFVQAHGGRIWAENRPEGGAKFTFTLPGPGEAVSAAPAVTSRVLAYVDKEEQAPVLLVEGDDEVVNLVRNRMGNRQLIQAQDRSQIRDVVRLHHPQAIIWNQTPSDTVPDPDQPLEGLADASVPMIFCSLPSRSWTAENLGVAACLSKPITSERLLSEIDRLGVVERVLVVDDDRVFCRLIDRMLLASGRKLTVRQAYDGRQGLQVSKELHPDVMVLDPGLPGMDGLEMLGAMRADADLQHIPVLLLSNGAYGPEDLAQRRSQLRVVRSGGLGSADTLRCLEALVGVLQPQYSGRVRV